MGVLLYHSSPIPLRRQGLVDSLELNYVDQAGLEITEISLTLPVKCWDQRCALPHQAIFIFILFSLIFLLAIGNIFSYSYS